jgi:hypothetical protein
MNAFSRHYIHMFTQTGIYALPSSVSLSSVLVRKDITDNQVMIGRLVRPFDR